MDAISSMRGKPRRFKVVPHVFSIRRWGATKKDDSLEDRKSKSSLC